MEKKNAETQLIDGEFGLIALWIRFWAAKSRSYSIFRTIPAHFGIEPTGRLRDISLDLGGRAPLAGQILLAVPIAMFKNPCNIAMVTRSTVKDCLNLPFLLLRRL
ncbi:uncharacterized protein VTP21DRAFT_119 [Calcarisporiella thermophila]|uniref:uncharacterized protein n=1 Tax=Calcarisporiella thermophila TaxID=911321 RepID=UPI003743304C